LYRAANSAILKFIREWKENAGNFRPAEDESMDKIIIRPMTPEDWGAVSRIYVIRREKTEREKLRIFPLCK